MAEPALLSDLAAQLRAAHTALLLIDMQHDFCSPGYGADRAGRDIAPARACVPTLVRLLAAARAARVPIAHIGFWTLPDHMSDSPAWLGQRRKATYSSDSLCIADTPGAGFIDELSPQGHEWIVRKHRYSAFTGTDLDMLLRGRDIRSIVVCGVSTNACVESTFRAGFELGYHIAVPVDGCASWDGTLHEAALANVRHRFGATPTAEEIVAIWANDACCG